MPDNSCTPAAEYVRMSTERQEFSIENQTFAIRRYADAHGFQVIECYHDAGKSGVTLRCRLACNSCGRYAFGRTPCAGLSMRTQSKGGS